MFRVVRARGDRPSRPLSWADEKRAVFTNFELESSAFSVARRFCDGGRRDGPPLAPPFKGGEKERVAPSNGGEAPRNIRGGKSPLLILQDFNRPAWPSPSQRGETKSEPPFARGERQGEPPFARVVGRGTALARIESEVPSGGSKRARPGLVPRSCIFPGISHFSKTFRPAIAPGWRRQVSETVFGVISSIQRVEPRTAPSRPVNLGRERSGLVYLIMSTLPYGDARQWPLARWCF